MIRFGIAGIPLTSKGRTFIDSVEETHNLGLNALEVQLLRVNVQENSAEEYTGLRPQDVEDSIIIDVLRQDEDGNYRSVGIDTEIEEDDIVQELFWNMARNYDELQTGGELAKELDVTLSMHAPYYMDMIGSPDIAEKSINHLRWTLILGKYLGARRVVTHSGFYHGSKKDSLNKFADVYSDILNEFSPDNGYPYIGVETSGKQEVFGTPKEVLELARRINIEPILNFAHVHAITGGSLVEIKDFESIINDFKKYAKFDLYTEFSGVEFVDNEERRLTAIKHGTLKFETLSEYLIDYQDDMTIISSSPLLEHDAQYMQIIYVRSYFKKMQRKRVAEKPVSGD
ncbi:MAG: TIM barrel protein [Thermoplasma acidophilum]|nr:TIM barrel protein [Thermoplasma acidophilum]